MRLSVGPSVGRLVRPLVTRFFGQRPRQGTKACRMGRFSICPFTRSFVRPSPLRVIQPGLTPSQPGLRPRQAASQTSGFRTGWLAGWPQAWLDGLEGGDGRTDKHRLTNKWKNIKSPYRGHCPASSHENQEKKSRARVPLMPLGYLRPRK